MIMKMIAVYHYDRAHSILRELEPSEHVSQNAYAKYKGVQPSDINSLVRNGVLTLCPDGKLDVENADRLWDKRPRAKKKVLDFQDARTRKMEADADRSEMEAEQMAKNLVSRDSVVEEFEKAFAIVTKQLEAIPVKLGPVLAIETDARICTAKLKSTIHQVLSEMARHRRTESGVDLGQVI